MHRSTSGFALVVTMLVALVVLIVIVTTASISTLGARRNVSDERQTYRAQLVAESGLNTFPARMIASDIRVADPLADAWVQCPDRSPDGEGHDAFCFTGLGQGAEVALSLEVVDAERITVSSMGTIGTSARKIVVDDFSVKFEPAFHVPLGAALTSLPYVKVGGDASINGLAGTGSGSGVIENVTTVATAVSETLNVDEGSFSVDVQDATWIPEDGYLRIGDRTYRVATRDGNTLELDVLPPPEAAEQLTIGSGTTVDLVPFAATGPASIGGTSTVSVTDTAGFVEGMKVFIDGSSGIVASVNPTDHTVTINWEDGADGEIAEGDAFSRSVYDVASGNLIDVNGNAYACGYVSGGVGEYDETRCADSTAEGNPLPTMTADELFEATLGYAPDAFDAAFPPVATFNGHAGAMQVINVDGSLNLSGSTAICGGPAILVVHGDLTLNGSCDPTTADATDGGFHGLIYVTGQFRQQGNSDIYGAVVVDGSYSNVGPDTTTVTGTNNPKADGSKIQYDMSALLQAGSALAPRTFKAIPGTWRQR